MGSLLKPKEIAESWIGIGAKKAGLSGLSMVLLGIMAGIFIGFGAHGYLMVSNLLAFDPGVSKLLAASVFPVGIMMVVLAGAELFTGNNLMTVSVMSGEITLGQMLKNWTFVFLGNLVGSVVLALLLKGTGLYEGALGQKAVAVASAKVNLSLSQAFIRGFLCNILVVIAVWMQGASKDVISKLFALWFPVMLFVLSGFEHSIANLFFIPLGIASGADISILQMMIGNIIPVALGNVAGGALFVPIVYYWVYLKGEVKNKEKVLLS